MHTWIRTSLSLKKIFLKFSSQKTRVPKEFKKSTHRKHKNVNTLKKLFKIYLN